MERIQCNQLSKQFRPNRGIKNITCSFKKGKIYGLIGPNASGKTTFLQTLCGRLLPTGGTLSMDNMPMQENPIAIQKIVLAHNYKPNTSLSIGSYYQTGKLNYPLWDEDYFQELVRIFQVNLKGNISALSFGNLTLFHIIFALSTKAPIVLLDEPTTGLDAINRDQLYRLIVKEHARTDRTFIISTHQIDEMSDLFEEILMIKKGELLLQKPTLDLLENAYFIRGNEAQLAQITKQKNVIATEQFGSAKILVVYDNFSEMEKQNWVAEGLDFSSIPIQKLFVYLMQNQKNEVSL